MMNKRRATDNKEHDFHALYSHRSGATQAVS